MDAAVFDAMKPFFANEFGNPSALYTIGRSVKCAVDNARKRVARTFGAQPDTIIFTSGGTESDNMAILGIAQSAKGHIITTKIEHDAVLGPCQELERRGWDVTYLDVDAEGQISVEAFKKALREDTVLVSIMYANNEIGTILPIADIGREIIKWRKGSKRGVYPYFHTDACQAAGTLEMDVEKLHVDLMTINGSKIYGPKGSGVLYKRRGVSLQPIVFGGGQEMGYRAGTENVAAIVGLGEALERRHDLRNKTQEVRNYLWDEIQKRIERVELNGPSVHGNRLANNLNVVFHGVEAEALLLYLDEYGITVGTGSACATGSDEGSHVLRAIRRSQREIESSIRFSLGKETSTEDIDYVMEYLPAIVMKLRMLNRN